MKAEYKVTAIGDDEGCIKLNLNPNDSTEYMCIRFFFHDDGFYFHEQVDDMENVTNSYIKLELKSPVELNVTSNERMAS